MTNGPDSQEIVFDIETSIQTWAKGTTILLGLYLSILLGPLLDGKCPYPLLIFGLPAGLCGLGFLTWQFVRERYLFLPEKREFVSEIGAFSFRLVRRVATVDELVGIAIHAEFFETRTDREAVFYYQVVLALKDGRILPLSNLAQEGWEEARELATRYARKMEVEFVSGPEGASVEVVTRDDGRKAICYRPYRTEAS